jgi:hypothetical protein
MVEPVREDAPRRNALGLECVEPASKREDAPRRTTAERATLTRYYAGKSNVNVVPAPGALSTVSVPP